MIERNNSRMPRAHVGAESSGLPALHLLRLENARPDVSVVVPVNAREDLDTVVPLLHDLARYTGDNGVEIVLVVNNYRPEEVPPAVAEYQAAGVTVVAVPSAWVAGEVVSFSARIPGVRAASAPFVLLFDADCRVPDASALVDWYVEQLSTGASVAYTRVDYYELRPLLSVQARIVAHHTARWMKRNALRIPTVRGSNYAILRSLMLRLYDAGMLGDDMNVGPVAKADGCVVRYSGASQLTVLTSGRRFRGGWRKLGRYLLYRFRYNLRVVPVSAAARAARRQFHARNQRAGDPPAESDRDV